MRVCRTCAKEFEPSSRHADCPACRDSAKRRPCAGCGVTLIYSRSRLCKSCAQIGNKKALKGRFSPYLRLARQRKHEFDLDNDYLEDLWARQNGRCAYSGLPMRLFEYRRTEKGVRGIPTDASLDRIDSSRGYVRGNVQFVCVALN